ncbi:MAG: hypothetical protein IPL61_40585 [Myxococcales bacterium]|nr:hypothetical protein [Myxococcales bacterium]
MSTLASLATSFRTAYLDHATIAAQLAAWHAAFPDLTRLTTIGTTPEGRALTVLTIGVDPDRARPTAWVDGNMHAAELAGSSVALAIAEDFLAAHVEPDRLAWSPALIAAARATRLFVLPRMSPDGAECVLTTGRFVRSAPRDDRGPRGASAWQAGDVDGDGRILAMRVADPAGDFVAPSPEHPDLLVARELGDAGPFYRLFPEGTIARWDGFTIPPPSFVGDNPVDLNRNFPWSWAPVHEQIGAGRFPAVGAREPRGGRVRVRPPRDLRVAEPPHLRRGVHPPARPRRRQQARPGRPRALPPARGLGHRDHRLPDGVGLRGVPLRARPAAARRPHRLRLPPARRVRVRRRAVGHLRAARPAAPQEVRRPLHPPDPRRSDQAGGVGSRPQPRPADPAVARGGPPAAGPGRGRRRRSADRHVEPAARAPGRAVREPERVLRPGRGDGARGGRAGRHRDRARRRPVAGRDRRRQPRLPADPRPGVGQEARVARAALRRAHRDRQRAGRSRRRPGRARAPRRLGPRPRRGRQRSDLRVHARQRRERPRDLAGARARPGHRAPRRRPGRLRRRHGDDRLSADRSINARRRSAAPPLGAVQTPRHTARADTGRRTRPPIDRGRPARRTSRARC